MASKSLHFVLGLRAHTHTFCAVAAVAVAATITVVIVVVRFFPFASLCRAANTFCHRFAFVAARYANLFINNLRLEAVFGFT